MKPDWDKLMDAFADSKTQLVADVDCTTEGKPLCETHAIQGFPTIKWGDPSSLEDYQGGRDFKSLKSFADKNLKPLCSPTNIDLCDDDKKAQIKSFQDMGEDKLAEAIAVEEQKIEDAEKDFKEGVQGLQAQYKKMMMDKEDAISAVKEAGLGLMKAVKASMGKAVKDEL